MSVTEVHQASGSWSIGISKTIPRQILNVLDYFGHIAIIPGRVEPLAFNDNLLSVARYVGVLRDRNLGDSYSISGVGMAIWLGDEDDKGDVFENKVTFASANFADTIRALLPNGGSITEGTIHSVPGLYNGTHQWETPKTAITYVTDTYGADWRVNYNGTLDAGLTSDLFVTNPKCLIARRGSGVDMNLRAIPGAMTLDRDMQDFTTRVVLLAEGDGDDIATGTADIAGANNPYKDIHGNTVVRTRMVSESDTVTANADSRATLQLNRFISPNNSVTLGAKDLDIRGDFAVGDYVWVYDPDSGLINTANEIIFRGERWNAIPLRVVESTWPVTPVYTVAYRSGAGTWYDITKYVAFESLGSTSVTVGDVDRQLTSSGFEPVGSRPNADTSVPGVPTFITPFTGATYLDSRGFTKAQLIVNWSAPLNVDGSTVIDGDHYEVRYAIDSGATYPATWNAVSVIRWEDMQAWEQPFAAPSATWHYVNVAWDNTSVRIPDLAPGIGYVFEIRAVDTTGNQGAWSASTVAVTTADNIPPSQPQPPTVAGSRIAIQIIHNLGKTSAGDFTLESDLDHLEIHVGYSDTFFPDTSTLVGKLKANAGMIAAQVPAVGTYQIEQTYQVHVKVVAVDITGNKSIPSGDAVVTAELIDDAHISDLTVSKLTAGTIGADFIVGARIKTADSGARVELNSSGLQAYSSAGTQTVSISAADGSVSIVGTFKTGSSGNRIEVSPASIKLFSAFSAGDYAQIWATGLIDSHAFMVLDGSVTSLTSGTLTLDYQSAAIAVSGAGGKCNLSTTDAQIVVWNSGNTDVSAWLVLDNVDEKMYYLKGKNLNFVDEGPSQGWFTADVVFTGSPTSAAVSYGTTRVGQNVPIITVGDNPATPYAWSVSPNNTSGFTVNFGAAANGSVDVAVWAFRVV